jgi:peptide/nickel transport system permease protein
VTASALFRRRRARPAGAQAIAAGIVLVLVLAVAFAGPLVAGSPTELVGPPFSGPSSGQPLGTDYLGEDVLRRILHGGRSVIVDAGIATLLAYLLGASAGLFAAYRGGWRDAALMRLMDVLLAFPPILFLLIVATGAGSSQVALILSIAIIHTPAVARIVRAATLAVVGRAFVEAAIARGDPTATILRREVLPNIWPQLVADAGPRFTVSILLVAAVSFLGLGPSPPTPDWALMISENRGGITINVLSVLAPAAVIGLLTVAINVLGDALARGVDRSIDVEYLRR